LGGNPGKSSSYAFVRIPYCDGMMLRASLYGIGTTEIVLLIVPVTLKGYKDAIGFGEDSLLDASVHSIAVATLPSKHINKKAKKCICMITGGWRSHRKKM
jgi:hypothetical protein